MTARATALVKVISRNLGDCGCGCRYIFYRNQTARYPCGVESCIFWGKIGTERISRPNGHNPQSKMSIEMRIMIMPMKRR
jgi:hypothetical protein